MTGNLDKQSVVVGAAIATLAIAFSVLLTFYILLAFRPDPLTPNAISAYFNSHLNRIEVWSKDGRKRPAYVSENGSGVVFVYMEGWEESMQVEK